MALQAPPSVHLMDSCQRLILCPCRRMSLLLFSVGAWSAVDMVGSGRHNNNPHFLRGEVGYATGIGEKS
eukprot:1305005-Amphidinium_carterae.2